MLAKSKPLSRDEIAQAVAHRLAHPFQCKRCQQYVERVNVFQECNMCVAPSFNTLWLQNRKLTDNSNLLPISAQIKS